MKTTNTLQQVFAILALFFFPFPVLKFGVSITYADIFLLLAMLLNAHELQRFYKFQTAYLLAFPFFLISCILDTDADLESLAQSIFIWGIVLPFGWTAFTSLSNRTMATVLIISSLISAGVAVGQSFDKIPLFENQKQVAANLEFKRAAGMSLSCNSLVMSLTPAVVLIEYLPLAALRLSAFSGLASGLIASVSKSVVFAVPGILYALWREPRKHRWIPALILGLGIALSMDRVRTTLSDSYLKFIDSVEHRAGHADDSIEHRTELIMLAIEYSSDCWFHGFGINGAYQRTSETTGNAVHVYYLGILLIAGYPGLLLLLYAFFTNLRGLIRQKEWAWSMFLLSHMLACSVTTVLFLSVQSMPFLVAAAAMVRRDRELLMAAHQQRLNRSNLRRAA